MEKLGSLLHRGNCNLLWNHRNGYVVTQQQAERFSRIRAHSRNQNEESHQVFKAGILWKWGPLPTPLQRIIQNGRTNLIRGNRTATINYVQWKAGSWPRGFGRLWKPKRREPLVFWLWGLQNYFDGTALQWHLLGTILKMAALST